MAVKFISHEFNPSLQHCGLTGVLSLLSSMPYPKGCIFSPCLLCNTLWEYKIITIISVKLQYVITCSQLLCCSNVMFRE